MTCTADHKEPANWLDTSMPGGKIRTVCKECGRFLGYRDAATDKQDRTIGRSKKR